MKEKITEIIYDFISDKMEYIDFFNTILIQNDIQEFLGDNVYYELLDLNSDKKDEIFIFKRKLKSICNFSYIHFERINYLLNSIKSKTTHIEELKEIYYFASIGYDFLYEIEIISNLFEQGKSVLYSDKTLIIEYNINTEKINKQIENIQLQLKDGRIKLTGRIVNEYYGTSIYEYEKCI